MQFGKALGTACVSFAITNIDDLFVLVTFFAESSKSRVLTPLKIWIGQLIGFTVIVGISMIGFAVALVLPSEPIGFLGLLPILLGVWKFSGLCLRAAEEEEESEQSKIAGVKSVLKVTIVTMMNGGDNIGTYVPLFSQARGAEIAVYVVTYYIGLCIWCLGAFLIMRQKHILALTQRFAAWLIPVLYVGLGTYITIKSSCYPWSIHRINTSTSTKKGRLALALATTFSLLICIAIMFWIRYRKRANVSPMSTNGSSSNIEFPQLATAHDEETNAGSGPYELITTGSAQIEDASESQPGKADEVVGVGDRLTSAAEGHDQRKDNQSEYCVAAGGKERPSRTSKMLAVILGVKHKLPYSAQTQRCKSATPSMPVVDATMAYYRSIEQEHAETRVRENKFVMVRQTAGENKR